MRVTSIQSIQEFADLEQDWQRIAECDEQASFFSSWAWNWLWWQHYAHLGQLHIIVVHKEDQLIAIAPFYKTLTRLYRILTADTLRFLGSGSDTTPDDLTVIAMPDERDQALALICTHLFSSSLFSRLQLRDIPESSTFWRVLNLAKDSHSGFALKPIRHRRPYTLLPASWAEYRQQISRNTHKQIKRRHNNLERSGNFRFHRCTEPHEVTRASAALVHLHHARWRTKGQAGGFRSEAYINFHRELIDDLLSRQQLWLMTLELDENIIGVEYAYCYKGTLALFQAGFDPEYEHLSPGQMLMTYAIKEAIAEGLNSIDMLKGDYSYKSSYASGERISMDFDYCKSILLTISARGVGMTKRLLRLN